MITTLKSRIITVLTLNKELKAEVGNQSVGNHTSEKTNH